jgi:1,4-dihydroxy-6-naphthoate synthase
MRAPLRLGFSPCPNDTFAFHALVHGLVDCEGLRFAPHLADIEELNRLACAAEPLAITKLSMGALAAVSDRYAALPAGAALGRGVGPLVVVRDAGCSISGLDELRDRRVAIPGVRTTAFLLLQLFAPPGLEIIEMRFDRILGAVERGEVDAGLIIHESRFTYSDHGLRALVDVGELWEQDTGLPLPLAVIAARRDLGQAVHDAAGRALRRSVEFAFEHPERSRGYIRDHAQEMAETVCDRHIALYVNAFSVDLGAEGRAAVDALLERGRALGLLAQGPAPWR